MTCKNCIHYEPCFEYGNILDPIHGGVICDNFKTNADYVEVVRCKDCKDCDLFYPCKAIDEEEPIPAYYCEMFKQYRKPTDYCSYGKRKDRTIV